MSESSFVEVVNLLEVVSKKGLIVTYRENELNLKIPKGYHPDKELLQKLKNSKSKIIQYLKDISREELDVLKLTNITNNAKIIDNETYYEITPTQEYWVNEDKDKDYKEHDELHGSVFLTYKINGTFEPLKFKQAINLLVERHECLKYTFHKINNKFMLKATEGNSTAFEPEIIEFNHSINDSEKLKSIINFSGHKFFLNKGPLFLSRIVKLNEYEHIISIKIHHVIDDTWSDEVLMSDLLHIYYSLISNSSITLSPLEFQFKNYLGLINSYNTKYLKIHKEYWASLYSSLPKELTIPYQKDNKNQSNQRILEQMALEFPQELVSKFGIWTKQYSTTTFVLLQASFKFFIYSKTGQADIVIGTNVSGRDYVDTRHQVGSYARTSLIRTVFNPTDKFPDALKKVVKSNADMVFYRAYTLTDHIDSMLNNKDYSSFWKINILYSDKKSGFYSKGVELQTINQELNLKFEPIQIVKPNTIPIDFILRFLNLKSGLKLDFQYDGSLYSESSIQRLLAEYLEFLSVIFQN